MKTAVESDYPNTFRHEDAHKLGICIKIRHSVVLIGMKRVGISNFLRFFLYQKNAFKKYIDDPDENHLFVPVDLNDLVERELFPFWMLILKRITDSVNDSDLDPSVKAHCEKLLLECIQSKDLLLLIDSVRSALTKIIETNTLPTLFLIRFDRMSGSLTPENFANIEGLINSTNQKLAFVLTTYRDLNSLEPGHIHRPHTVLFSKDIYLKPAVREDMEVIFKSFQERYKISFSKAQKEELFNLVGGYIQYLQLALIILNEVKWGGTGNLLELLTSDERITIQSQELWESLSAKERKVLLDVHQGKQINGEEREEAAYLWNTGLVVKEKGKDKLFSPLFGNFVNRTQEVNTQNGVNMEFSNKEYKLFELLKQRENQIVDRDAIITFVWPEEESLGVSDWVIDQLVARLRSKLKKQKSEYEIVTVRTRGYKLTTN